MENLSETEWRKLGVIAFIAFSAFQISLTLIHLFFPGTPGAMLYANYLLASVVYALVYSIYSFIYMYYEGGKVFKSLIVKSLVIPVALIAYILFALAFGPHG